MPYMEPSQFPLVRVYVSSDNKFLCTTCTYVTMMQCPTFCEVGEDCCSNALCVNNECRQRVRAHTSAKAAHKP